jgi:hypothetical protein
VIAKRGPSGPRFFVNKPAVLMSLSKRLYIACGLILCVFLWNFKGGISEQINGSGHESESLKGGTVSEANQLDSLASPSEGGDGDWQVEMGEALSSSEDTSVVFRNLIALVKKVPTAAQVTLAKHITNLASDDDYKELIPMMRDRTLGSRFHQKIAMDALNRPDEIKLPVMLEVATSDWHPSAEKMRSVLALILKEDPEEDWDRWRQLVAAKLAESAAEKAASDSAQPATPGNQ